jgi:hypothetical protein
MSTREDHDLVEESRPTEEVEEENEVSKELLKTLYPCGLH